MLPHYFGRLQILSTFTAATNQSTTKQQQKHTNKLFWLRARLLGHGWNEKVSGYLISGDINAKDTWAENVHYAVS